MDFQVNLIGRKNLSGEIYRQIRNAIGDGRLRPGDCLPASRDLAESLKVSRTTVTVAYDRLAGEGFIVSRIGAGTYVNNHVVRTTREERRVAGSLQPRAVWDSISISRAFDAAAQFDFRTGLPDASLFPHETWRRLVVQALRSEAVAGGVYGEPAGHRGLREAIARHIGISRGVQVSADDITITSGAQQSLDLIARALLEPGDRVAVEDPGYHPPRFLFQSLGAEVHGVSVDSEGILVDQMPRKARLVYVTPSHQYPLGVTMSLPRRLALLDWADRNNAAIIEDDYDSEFRYTGRPLAALQGLDPEQRVIYIGTLSKVLFPSIRIGYIVAPPELFDALLSARCLGGHQSPTLEQAVLADFISEGHFARHIRRMRVLYAERQQALVNAAKSELKGLLEIRPSDAGMHLLGWLPEHVDDRSAFRAAIAAGVEVTPLSAYSIEPPKRGALRLGYTGYKPREIWRATRRLAGALQFV